MKPRTNWFTKLLRFAGIILIVLPAAGASLQQDDEAVDRGPEPRPLPTRCATVSLTESSVWLSGDILAGKLTERAEFQAAGLKLVELKDSPDVQLTIKDEFDEHQSFQQAGGRGYRDAYIHALRVRDGKTFDTKVISLGSYEGIVAEAAIDALHQVCPAVMTTVEARRLSVQTPDPAVIASLQQARSLTIDSFTYLDDEDVRRRLSVRPEVQGWGLAVKSDRSDSDLRLEIHRLRNSSTWRCDLFDRSHRLLWMHSAGALTEEHAVDGIVDGLIDQIARYRETPKRAPIPRRAKRVVRGAWYATRITGDFRTTLQPFAITVDGERFVARNQLGQAIFTIAAEQLEDVEHSTVRDPIFQFSPPPAGFVSYLDEVDEKGATTHDVSMVVGAVAGLGAYCVAAAAVTTLLFPFGPKQHFIEIAWHEGDREQKEMFQLRGKDAGQLLDAITSLIDSEKERKYSVSARLGRAQGTIPKD